MKRIIYLLALAMFLALSCQKNESVDEGMSGTDNLSRALDLRVSDDPETRVGFDNDGAFYWQKGDNVGVQTSAGLKEMTLDDEYQGQSSGVFYGDFVEPIGEYVVYPFGPHVIDGELLTYVLPSIYTYTSIADGANSYNPPMSGVIKDDSSVLKHLASFIKICVNNIPAGGDDMKLVLVADKRLTGDFGVDLSSPTPVMMTDDEDGNIVTINFTNTVSGSNGVFYIPVPLGFYGEIGRAHV